MSEEFWKNKKVLITGHTGFKGVWLTFLLKELGAEVVGMSLPVSDQNKFYLESEISRALIGEYFLDLSTTEVLGELFDEIKPDYIFHLAAQAFVFEGIENPVQTFSTNVIGTVRVLDALLKSNHCVLGICIATTDKVYAQSEINEAFKETDPLGGTDPYSASKVGTELVVTSMQSKMNHRGIRVTVARAGNVVGGGDWGSNRLLPDLVRSYFKNDNLTIRNPNATRPFQHVLDCLWGYARLGEYSIKIQSELPIICNFGPSSSLSVNEVVDIFEDVFHPKFRAIRENHSNFERQKLELDSRKATEILNWKPHYSSRHAVLEAINFYFGYSKGENLRELVISSFKKWLFYRG